MSKTEDLAVSERIATAARSRRSVSERDIWVRYRDQLPEDDPRRVAVDEEIRKMDRRSKHPLGVRQGSEEPSENPIGGNGLVRSQRDRLIVEDFDQYAEDGWRTKPGNAVVLRDPRDLWSWVMRARQMNWSTLPDRQIEALGLVCFGEWLEFAHICWWGGTVESLQAMLSIVHQQALEGLLFSKKVSALMRWTRPSKKYPSRPVSDKNAQQYIREALNRLGLEREELLVLLSRGILDRIEWTARGRWAGPHRQSISAAQGVE